MGRPYLLFDAVPSFQMLARGSGDVRIVAGIRAVTIDAVCARFAAEAGRTC
jgi:hypothetical protein